MIIGLLLYNTHANTKDRRQDDEDSTESRGAFVLSLRGTERASGAQVRRSPSKERIDVN